jgi:RNA polymerase sigma factor (sigma-70 family)
MTQRKRRGQAPRRKSSHCPDLGTKVPSSPNLRDYTDPEAAEAFRPLVYSIAHRLFKYARYSGRRVLLEDLVQAGWIGFYRAKRKWSVDRNVPLGAYASIWVRGAITREVWGRRPTWENQIEVFTDHETALRLMPAPEKRDDYRFHDYLASLEGPESEVLEDIYRRQIDVGAIALEHDLLFGDVVKIAEDCLRWLQDQDLDSDCVI